MLYFVYMASSLGYNDMPTARDVAMCGLTHVLGFGQITIFCIYNPTRPEMWPGETQHMLAHNLNLAHI